MAENRGSVLTLDQTMAGILAMLVADREDRLAPKGDTPKRTELILADAGLSHQQIAGLLGKKPNSVTKTISRARNRRDTEGGIADD